MALPAALLVDADDDEEEAQAVAVVARDELDPPEFLDASVTSEADDRLVVAVDDDERTLK